MVLTVLFGCLWSRLQKKKVEEDSTVFLNRGMCTVLLLAIGDFVTIHPSSRSQSQSYGLVTFSETAFLAFLN